jgi:hypothetical protein
MQYNSFQSSLAFLFVTVHPSTSWAIASLLRAVSLRLQTSLLLVICNLHLIYFGGISLHFHFTFLLLLLLFLFCLVFICFVKSELLGLRSAINLSLGGSMLKRCMKHNLNNPVHYLLEIY